MYTSNTSGFLERKKFLYIDMSIVPCQWVIGLQAVLSILSFFLLFCIFQFLSL